MYKTKIFNCLLFTSLFVPSFGLSDIVFSGDFDAGSRQMEITEAITFNMTSSTDVFGFVFDEVVIDDSTQSDASPNQDLNLVNAGAVQAVGFAIIDNIGSIVGDMTPNDGYIGLNNSESTAGTAITLEAGQYTFDAALGAPFNPAYSSLTFQGNMFVVDLSGSRISDVVSVGTVPEPTSFVLLASLGLWCFRRHRVMHHRTKTM